MAIVILKFACSLFNFFFAVGWLAIPWLYPAEIAPLQIRSKAAALSTMTNWLFTFLVVMITPTAIGTIGYKTYIVWACTNFAFIPITYFFYVETTGQTLEDIDLLFEGAKTIFLGPSSAKRASEIRRNREQQLRAALGTGTGVHSSFGEKGGSTTPEDMSMKPSAEIEHRESS